MSINATSWAQPLPVFATCSTRLGVYDCVSVAVHRGDTEFAGCSVIFVLRPKDVVNHHDLSFRANWLIMKATLKYRDVVGDQRNYVKVASAVILSPFPVLIKSVGRCEHDVLAAVIWASGQYPNGFYTDVDVTSASVEVRSRLLRILNRVIILTNLGKKAVKLVLPTGGLDHEQD